MADLWPQKLLDELPYPGPTTGWLADPANAPAWWPEVRLSRFRPTQVSGCVLWLDPRVTEGVVLANASIGDGANLHSSSWTHTNVTPSYNQDGLGGTQFTVSSTTTPRATQNIANSGTHTTAQPPCTITVKYKAGTAPFLLVESVAAAANRTWVNLSTHAIGTSGANHSAVSVSAADSLGYRTVSVTMNANALGTTPTARFTLVSADNVTTGASVGQTIWLKDATVDQPRANLVNLVSGAAWTQSTAFLQLGYEVTGINGQACVRGYGSQYVLSTEAAVIAAASGDDKALTLVAVLDKVAADDVLIGLANAASTGNTNYWDLVRLDSFRASKGDSGANTALATGTAMANGPHVVTLSFAGTTVTATTDGVTTMNAAAFNVGSTTLDTIALFCRPRSTPAEIGSGRLGACALYNRVLTADELAYVRQGLARGGSDPYGIQVAA
jgi:hypothetical protein